MVHNLIDLHDLSAGGECRVPFFREFCQATSHHPDIVVMVTYLLDAFGRCSVVPCQLPLFGIVVILPSLSLTGWCFLGYELVIPSLDERSFMHLSISVAGSHRSTLPQAYRRKCCAAQLPAVMEDCGTIQIPRACPRPNIDRRVHHLSARGMGACSAQYIWHRARVVSFTASEYVRFCHADLQALLITRRSTLSARVGPALDLFGRQVPSLPPVDYPRRFQP